MTKNEIIRLICTGDWELEFYKFWNFLKIDEFLQILKFQEYLYIEFTVSWHWMVCEFFYVF